MSPPDSRAPALSEIEAARHRVAALARVTPLERSESLSDAHNADIHLKLECWQPTRSFKVRGACNAIALLTPEQRARGIVTASAGNHGQAIALAARTMGVRAIVFVPASAPHIKQDRIRRLGAELRVDQPDYDAAERAALDFAAREEFVFVSAFSDPDVIAGAGTIALELLDQLPSMREVIVPVGGGGLIAGIGIALKTLRPDVRVIGVQSTETRAMHAAFAAGRAVDVEIPPTLADGLSGCTDQATYERARAVVDELVLVEESAIADAIRVLHAHDGVVAEGSGAVGIAALRSGVITVQGPAAFVITGGNIDSHKFAAVLAHKGDTWR